MGENNEGTKAIAMAMGADASKAGVASAVTVSVDNKPIAKYMAVASKPAEQHIKDSKGEGVVCTNKRAATVALVMVLAEMAGMPVKQAATNASVIALASKLATYFVGYSKIKGGALKGGEVTSGGARGYARFVSEGYTGGRREADVKKLLPNGELHARVTAQLTTAKLVVAQYGKVEGIDAMLAACKAKAKPVTPASK